MHEISGDGHTAAMNEGGEESGERAGHPVPLALPEPLRSPALLKHPGLASYTTVAESPETAALN